MAKYYGVQRSDEYLVHYGVRGMKWGVRKSLEKGDIKRLSKHYSKAKNKLAKLDNKANIEYQKNQQVKYAKRAAAGLGASAIGIGGIFGAKALRNLAGMKYNKAVSNLRNSNAGVLGDSKSLEFFVANNPMAQKHLSAYQNKAKVLNNVKIASAALDLGGLAYGGYSGARSLASAYRQTSKGHAKAISKRDAWKREMNKAFAGTKYAKKHRK